jgi:hypothetical protein
MPLPSMTNIITPDEGEGIVNGPSVPGTGPVISIRTDPEAMMNDGIPVFGGVGMGRQVRRNSYRSMGGMNQMMPATPRYTPMEGGAAAAAPSPNMPIRITKLE